MLVLLISQLSLTPTYRVFVHLTVSLCLDPLGNTTELNDFYFVWGFFYDTLYMSLLNTQRTSVTLQFRHR